MKTLLPTLKFVICLYLFLALGILSSQAQNQANVWVFGTAAIMDFNGGAPVATGGAAIGQLEGCASISDNNGNLLFYTDGQNVWNANHVTMPNGTGLAGNPSASQSSIIVPRPGFPDRYFIFTVPSGVGNLSFSEVDMTLNGGLGDVLLTNKNTFLNNNNTEKVTSISHANGLDFWVVSHELSNTTFNAYLVTSTGVNTTAVVSNVGSTHVSGWGYMKGSPNSNKVAVAAATYGEVFDFNNSSGTLSNPITLNHAFGGIGPYGVEFSPNGQLLYMCEWLGGSSIHQYDLNQPTQTLMINTRTTVNITQATGAIQLAPDGKIYIAHPFQQLMTVINAPDSIGTAMNLVNNQYSLAAGTNAQYGLPTFVQSFFNPAAGFTIGDTCFGDTTAFNYTGATVPDSVLWTFGDSLSGPLDTSDLLSTAHLYTDTGTYAVTLYAFFSDTLGNQAVDTVSDTIYIYPIPQVSFGNDTVLCTGDTLPYTLIGGDFNYLWSDSSTTSSIQITQVGTYWAEVSNLCGVASDTVDVDSIYFADVNFPNDTLLCDGDTISVSAWVPFGTYQWHDPLITSSTSSIDITTTGTYWAEATNLCGVGSDTIFVEFEVPPVTVLPNDTAMCDGATITPNVAFSRGTYLWSDGSTDSTLTIGSPGVYWAEVTNLCGVDSDTIVVDYDFPLNIDLGPDTVVCVGNSYILSPPTAGAAHLWQDNSTGLTMVVDQPGQYWLEATNLCGMYSDSVNVDYEVPPAVELGENQQLCDGDTVWFNVSFSRSTYAWSTGSIDSLVPITTENTYTVTVTNLCGSATDDVTMLFDFPVDPDLGPNQQVCQGQDIVLNGTQPNRATYVWNTADTVPIITATSSGLYWLKMTNACGTFGDTVTLLFRAPPKAEFNPSWPDTTFVCGEEGPGNSLVLSSEESATGYRWQDGSQRTSYEVTQEGLYWLEVSNECGSTRDSAYVFYQPNPALDLGVDTFFCRSVGGFEFNIFKPGASYLWIDGSTEPVFVPEEPGIYWAEITDRYGCVSTDDIRIDECPVSVWLPNAFTPNNDQINDIFKAEGAFLIEFELRVFNRWGQLLWKTEDIDRGWDGTHNGVLSKPGQYIYKLYYRGENTEEVTETSYFQLVR